MDKRHMNMFRRRLSLSACDSFRIDQHEFERVNAQIIANQYDNSHPVSVYTKGSETVKDSVESSSKIPLI